MATRVETGGMILEFLAYRAFSVTLYRLKQGHRDVGWESQRAVKRGRIDQRGPAQSGHFSLAVFAENIPPGRTVCRIIGGGNICRLRQS
jgi:hypothetical protein